MTSRTRPAVPVAADQNARRVRAWPVRRHRAAQARVPMDDGVELLADLYLPVGAVEPPLPTIVVRSPYGRHGSLTHAPALAGEGFTVLVQSCRGTGGSGGSSDPSSTSSATAWPPTGGYAASPGSPAPSRRTGRVTSATPSGRWRDGCARRPGNAPDALCLNVTMADFGAITWNNGAFSLGGSLGWSQPDGPAGRRGAMVRALLARRPDRKLAKAFGVLPLRAATPPWRATRSAGTRTGWPTRSSPTTTGPSQSHTASVHRRHRTRLHGHRLVRHLPALAAAQLRTTRRGRPPAAADHRPVGPRSASRAGRFSRSRSRFLKEHFAGAPAPGRRPCAPSSPGPGGRPVARPPAWPPPGARVAAWYLHPSGLLDPAAPDGGVTRYGYDPTGPHPALGGPSLLPHCGPVDNAPTNAAPDVAVFRSAPLADAVVVAGEPVAEDQVPLDGSRAPTCSSGSATCTRTAAR